MSTRDLAEMAIIIALTAVMEIIFTNLNLAIFANGGSISISMIPIILLSLRRGFKVGFITALVYGVFQFLLPLTVYYLTPVQYLFDYVLPFTVLAFIALIKTKSAKNVAIGVIFVGLLKYASHVIAGIAFWGEYAPENFNAVTWSLYYNATYSVPSMILSALLLYIMVSKHSVLLKK